MTQENDDVFNDSAKDTTATGSDIPGGDGTISDEDMHALDANNDDGKPIGQDHSTENREDQMPTSGVGAFEDSSQPVTSGIAHIADDEEE